MSKPIVLSMIFTGLVLVFALLIPFLFREHYRQSASFILSSALATSTAPFVPTYLPTPEPVKGIYMTSWTAASPALREPLVKFIDDTELNSVVIDIKDYSGITAFSRIKDLPQFVDELHKKNIYVIGRVAVFQDALFVKERPDLAVKNLAGTAVWKDNKGISWIDAGSKEYWDYIVGLSKQARSVGFDEINFDYIRYPSDGDMHDISFPQSSTTPKTTVLKNFFAYLHNHLEGSGLKISADLFGMTTTAKDDMGIGQLLENTLPYFDYVSPMVYPSHYPPTFMGFKEPEAHPYDVVHFAMGSAVTRSEALASTTNNMASTTTLTSNSTRQGLVDYKNKLRPWLQDFGLRQDYGPTEVDAQIKATYDDGLTSWLLWSASNKYTEGALEKRQ